MPVRPSTLIFAAFMLCVPLAKLGAQEEAPLIAAIRIYNLVLADAYPIVLQQGAQTIPERTIALPAALINIPMTRGEAGALVAATGAYATPDTRHKPRTALDRAGRFIRLMQALESCPGALASITARFENGEPDGSIAAFLRYVRTERPEFAVAPDPDCARSR